MNIVEWEKMGLDLANEIDQTSVPAGSICLWYLGQEGFIIKSSEVTVGIDLVLSELYNAQGKTRRAYPPPFEIPLVPELTHIFCTHGHADHFDLSTVKGVLTKYPYAQSILPGGTEDRTAALDNKQISYAIEDQEIRLSEHCSVLPIAVAHETYEKDEQNHSLFFGYLFNFFGISLFHCGDAIFEPILEQRIMDIAPITVFMAPINGTDATRKSSGIVGNMDVEEAAKLAQIARARLAIPMHFDMFAHNGADPEGFVQEAKRIHATFLTWIPRLGTMLRIPG